MPFAVSAALLDACVLAVLDQGDTYGYELTLRLQRVMEISESTLYPVLRRLQKDACLSTYDEPYQGRNRRYYAITQAGRAQLARYRTDWTEYKGKVDALLSGGAQT